MRDVRRKMSRHAEVAKAIDYMLKRCGLVQPVPRRRENLPRAAAAAAAE
jgi:hypothetical protein